MGSTAPSRLLSIDLLRGLVILLMALDHARVFLHHAALFGDPTDLATTTPLIFLTRWVTHFCAPVFVLLAGVSAALHGGRVRRAALSRFLFSRGLWLVVIELTVINFAWTFDPAFGLHIFQVIWAIGVSMVVLSGLVWLPRAFVGALGLLIVIGHNLLDPVAFSGPVASTVWAFIHVRSAVPVGEDSLLFIVYPVLPWLGVMAAGYGLGGLYPGSFDPVRRRRWLLLAGGVMLVAFLILRALNGYGEPHGWERQDSDVMSILAFLKLTKYPPSLQFLLMTLGPALLLLGALDGVQRAGRLVRALAVFGRVPFFFYVIHLYLLHLAAYVGGGITGFALSRMQLTLPNFLDETLIDFGFGLGVVYAVWLGAVLLLYPLCKAFAGYKSLHRDRWWPSYL